MERLKELLVDEQPNSMDWWAHTVCEEPDPLLKDWAFKYFITSHIGVGETVEDAMKRQTYRLIASHKDGRTLEAMSTESFHQAYHKVVAMILAQ